MISPHRHRRERRAEYRARLYRAMMAHRDAAAAHDPPERPPAQGDAPTVAGGEAAAAACEHRIARYTTGRWCLDCGARVGD